MYLCAGVLYRDLYYAKTENSWAQASKGPFSITCEIYLNDENRGHMIIVRAKLQNSRLLKAHAH